MVSKKAILLFIAVGVTCFLLAAHSFNRPDEDSMMTSRFSVRDVMSDIPVFDRRSLSDSNNTESVNQILREKYGPIRYSGIRHVNTTLTADESMKYEKCVKNAARDRNKGNRFWSVQELRRTHHTYLKKEDAVLIEAGGNRGDDATEFVRLYNPRYIILEPLEEYANILKERFRNNSRVTVLNIGLGMRNEVVLVNIEGNNACATSKFSGAGGKTPLFVTNATEIMLKLGVGLFDVDLLTMNCEGCEYEALEMLTSTNLISHFKNIQFATHSTIKGIRSPLERYCAIEQLLLRTHRPTYQYRFIWESWRRRDIP